MKKGLRAVPHQHQDSISQHKIIVMMATRFEDLQDSAEMLTT